MRTIYPRLTALVLVLTVMSCQAQQAEPAIPASLLPEIKTAFLSVSPAAIHATMSFLADDLVEGRQPGTRGFALGRF